MQPKPSVSVDPQQRLDTIVTAYLKAVEAGQKPDRKKWLAAYPDVAPELSQFFADEDRMDRMAAPLRGSIAVDKATPRPPAAKVLNVPAAPPVGRFGDYELIAEIARGGMGVVYKARQVSVNRIVALKMILGGTVASQADVQRFHNEAEAAAHLDHPNIIPIYGVGTHDGRPFFTMKLITGGSLADRLPCSDADRKGIVALLAQVARAVHYAHQHGILHRDLKPANILITGHSDQSGSVEIKSSATLSGVHGPTPMVTDFGLAKLVQRGSDITRSGAIVGTPSYMAPEQAKGHNKTVSTAADVYSLGVMLYEALTGKVPFRGETALDTVLQLVEREATPPRQINRRIDADIETICLKCLEKDPNKRYESAEALAEELERWLAGDTIKARPAGRFRYAVKWVRRKPQLAAIAALVLLLAGLAPVAVAQWWKADSLLAAEAQAKDEANKARQQALQQADAENKAKLAAEDARHEAEHQAAIARRALAQAELQTYYSRIGQAESQWRIHNVPRLMELLDRCPEHLRSWEWNYLNRLCHLELHNWKLHNASVLWGAFCADGKRLASLGWDNKVRVSDAATGQLLWMHDAYGYWGSQAAVSRTGSLLAFPHVDAQKVVTVRIWDTEKKQEVAVLRGHRAPTQGIAFSPDGKRVATSGPDNVIKIWDAASGREERSLPNCAAYSLAFSSDGERLAAGGGDGTLKLFDVGSGEVKLATKAHQGVIFGLAFRPGSNVLATASADMTAKIWNTETGKELAVLDHNGFVFTVAFSRDGKRMATPSCDMTIKVWDAETMKEVFAMGGHTKPVMCVHFSPTDDRLVSVSSDATVRVWDTPTSLEAVVHSDQTAFRSADFSRDGKRVLTCTLGLPPGKAVLKVWEAASGKTLRTIPNVSSNGAFSPDGQRVAAGMGLGAGDPVVKLWDVESGQEVLTLKGHKTPPTYVAFHPDGKRLASLCNFANAQKIGQAEIKIWDLAGGKALATIQAPQVVSSGMALVFSADGKRLAAVTADNTAQVWDAETGKLLFTSQKHKDMLYAVAFSPDGRYLAESYGLFEERPQITIWDLSSGAMVHSLKGHFGIIWGLSFSPDGKRLASASMDRTVKLWDPATGEEVLTLHGHTGWVQSVTFSADGRRLLSASQDKTFRIWDATPPAAATARK